MSNLPQHDIPETRLAEEIGVHRDVLRACRQNGTVQEGVHWLHNSADGNRVIYTAAGVSKIREHLDLPPPPEKKEGRPDLVTCQVISHPTNPALLLCTVDGQPGTMRVRIRPSLRKSHGPGKLITARPIGDPAAGLLEFVPTLKGKPPSSPTAEPSTPGPLA